MKNEDKKFVLQLISIIQYTLVRVGLFTFLLLPMNQHTLLLYYGSIFEHVLLSQSYKKIRIHS